MKLKVQYTAQLRAAVGRAEEIVELPDNSSLDRLLTQLAQQWDSTAQSHLFVEPGRLRSSLILVLNGLAISVSDVAETQLRSGDVVILMPPIAGG